MQQLNNKEDILFTFDVIINPGEIGLFSLKIIIKTIKLFLFRDRLVFMTKPCPMEIPYSSITSIKTVMSHRRSEKKAYLYQNGREFTFGVASLINGADIDIELTGQVVNLIQTLRDKPFSCEIIHDLFSELKPGGLRIRKTTMALKFLLLVSGLTAILVFAPSVFKMPFWFLGCLFLIFIVAIWKLITPRYKAVADGYITKATYYLIKGDIDGAISKILELLKLYPNDIDVNWYIVKLYYRKKAWVKAKEYCQKVLSLNPSYPNAQELLKKLNELIMTLMTP